MPLSISISFINNKKICVPYKNSLTIKELIESVCKRSNLTFDNSFTLEFNDSELYQDKTLESLNIQDNSELVLKKSLQSTIETTTATINTTATTTTTTTTTTKANDLSSALDNLMINNNNQDNFNVIKCIDMIVLDCSGSMELPAFRGSTKPGELEMKRIELAQALFQTFIDKLVSFEIPTACGLVCFGSRIEVTFGITRNFDSFSTELGEVDANQGSTRLFEAIIQAAKTIAEFRDNPPSNIKLAPKDQLLCRVFCLTDGDDTGSVPVFDAYTALSKYNVILDSIPIGDGDRVCLSALSNATGGTCFIADSAEEGVGLFEREALLNLSSRELKPFIKLSTQKELLGLGGNYQKTIEVKVDSNLSASFKCKSIVDETMEKKQQAKGPTGKRILQEYKDLQKDIENDPVYSIFLNENDLSAWKIILKGPSNSPYENGRFVLTVLFPADYPFKPMKIRFSTKIYHCNISNDGNLCLDILKDQWSPALTIGKVLQSISSLLTNPNPNDPLDVVKAGVYRDSVDTYNNNVIEWIKNYASEDIEQIKKTYGLE